MTIAELYQQRIDDLKKQEIISQQKTQAILANIRSLVSDLEAIDFED